MRNDDGRAAWGDYESSDGLTEEPGSHSLGINDVRFRSVSWLNPPRLWILRGEAESVTVLGYDDDGRGAVRFDIMGNGRLRHEIATPPPPNIRVRLGGNNCVEAEGGRCYTDTPDISVTYEAHQISDVVSSVQLRIRWGRPSYLPSSREMPSDGTISIPGWGNSTRVITFTRAGYDDVQVKFCTAWGGTGSRVRLHVGQVGAEPDGFPC